MNEDEEIQPVADNEPPGAPPVAPAAPAQAPLQPQHAQQPQRMVFDPPEWEKVADKFTEAFPEADPEYVKKRYEQIRGLHQARRQAAQEYDPSGNAVLRDAVSMVRDPLIDITYQRAKKRVERGEPEDGDFRTMGMYETEKAYDQRRTSTGAGWFGRAATSLPSQILGFMAGSEIAGPAAGAIGAGGAGIIPSVVRAGITAAVTPNMLLTQGVQKNLEADRDPFDWRGLGMGGLEGAAQLILLSKVGALTDKFAPGLSDVGRVATQALTGTIAQQGMDAAAGALGLQTTFGPLEKLVHGELGEYARDTANTFVMFGIMGAMHGGKGPDRAKQFVERFNEAAEGPDPDAGPGRFPGDPSAGGGPAGARNRRAERAAKTAAGDVARDVLGVKVGATPEEIQAAYREKVKQHHPDRGGNPVEYAWVDWANDYLAGKGRASGRPKEARGQPWPPEGPPAAGETPTPQEAQGPPQSQAEAEARLKQTRPDLFDQPEAAKTAPEEPPAGPPGGPPATPPSQGPDVRPETAGDAGGRAWRVPDYKNPSGSFDAAMKELVSGPRGRVWASRDRTVNDGYHKPGTVQFEMSGIAGEGKDAMIEWGKPLVEHPGLKAVRFNGDANSEEFGRLKGLIDDANKMRAEKGLDPIQVEAAGEGKQAKGYRDQQFEAADRLFPFGQTAKYEPQQTFKENESEYRAFGTASGLLSDAYGIHKAMDITGGKQPWPSREQFHKDLDRAFGFKAIELQSEIERRLHKLGLKDRIAELREKADGLKGRALLEAMESADQRMRAGGMNAAAWMGVKFDAPEDVPIEKQIDNAKAALYDSSRRLEEAHRREARERVNESMGLKNELREARSARLELEREIDGHGDEPGLQRKLDDLRDNLHRSQSATDALSRLKQRGPLDKIRDAQKGKGPIAPSAPPSLRPPGATDVTPGRGAARDLLRQAGNTAAALRMQKAAREAAHADRPPPLEQKAAAASKDWRERVLGFRVERFNDRISRALKNPTTENIGQVAEDVERLVRMATSRGMDPAATLHDKLPGLERFLEMVSRSPAKLPPDEEELRAIDSVNAIAKRFAIEPASVRRSVEQALSAQSPSAGPPAAGPQEQGGQGVGQHAAGVPQAAGDELAPGEFAPPLGPDAMMPHSPEHPDKTASQFLDEIQAGIEPTSGAAKTLWDVATEMLKDETATFTFPGNLTALREHWKDRLAKVKRAAQYTHDAVGRMSGRMLPAITRFDRDAGEAVARWIAAKDWARRAADYYADLVLGDGASEDADMIAGAVHTERRLRYMRQAFEKKAAELADDASRLFGDAAGQAFAKSEEYREMAKKVKSVIGAPGSPLERMDQYRKVLASDRMQGILRRIIDNFVPVQEDNYRKAQGLEDDEDPINSFTQIPGQPMNLRSMRGGDKPTKSTVFTGAAGNLGNLRMGKFPFAVQAKGDADAYDVSMKAIIQNTLERGYPVAARAEAYRALHKAGLLKWGSIGAKKDFDGKPGIWFPDAKPPRGTQAAGRTDDGAYLHPDVAGEFRSAIAVDEVEGYQKVLSGVMTAPTVGALASSVEATTHGTNLFLSMFAPGTSPIDLARNAYARLSGSMAFRKRLLDLAQIGAVKAPGMESGSIAGPATAVTKFMTGADLPAGIKYGDPTYWGGKMLDAMSDIMRTTMADAYKRLAKRGKVPDTETGLRDFVNQWTGQYNKKAQNGMVRWLRNTKIGPFATASTTMTSRAVRSVFGGSGTTSTGAAAGVHLRALTLGKMAAMLAGSFALNYANWGRWDGDDATPWGAIKLGTDRQTGKTIFIDTPVSMVRRGLRAMGLLAMLDGIRHEQLPGVIADKMFDQVWHTMLAPAEGPGVQFFHTLRTGENAIGMHIAEKTEKGESKYAANAKAAIANFNPAVAALTGSDVPPKEEQSDIERWSKLLGPLGPKFRAEPKK